MSVFYGLVHREVGVFEVKGKRYQVKGMVDFRQGENLRI